VLHTYTIYCLKPVELYVAVSVWTVIWTFLGYVIGHRPRPERLVFRPESDRGNYEDARPVDLRTGAFPNDTPRQEVALPPEHSKQ